MEWRKTLYKGPLCLAAICDMMRLSVVSEILPTLAYLEHLFYNRTQKREHYRLSSNVV
jgi:hypothetical protein